MTHQVTLIPGDGIGPEVTEAARRALVATGVKFHWDIVQAGASAIEAQGTPLPPNVIESIRKNRVALKGPVTTPVGTGFRSVNVALRQQLELYACLRPCKTYPGVPTPYQKVDIVIVRENTEDLYAGIEFERRRPQTAELVKLLRERGDKARDDAGYSIKMISETASRRIVNFAFQYARTNGRRKVTAVHKANIMKFSDGIFLEAARDVARQFPDIEFDDRIVDNLSMQLVRRPDQFDVLVAPNLYGDIISDLCAGLVGGLGLAPGANIGDGIAVFEPSHGSAPKYSGLNRANPMAMMLSGVLMLRHMGELKPAARLEKAVAAVIAEGKDLTYDLAPAGSPAASTSRVADAVIEKLDGGVA
ncbi:MAG: isocitrate/isopropylmalate dehydrogenase family protein [Chloroflexota bacterium]